MKAKTLDNDSAIAFAKICLNNPAVAENNGRICGIPRPSLLKMHRRFGCPAHVDTLGKVRFIPFEVYAWLMKLDEAKKVLRERIDRGRCVQISLMAEILTKQPLGGAK